ncbi:MAG TPA: pantetheine-phosphate adenylyltransferase [Chitinophagales bacterium]|nr:pantetheine-phosphate adenylyltransferase [Chitinophagales bacterium]
MKNNIAVFPGSFDPITLGHVNLLERSLALYDKVIIAIGKNTHKQNLFSLEQRMVWIAEIFSNHPQVEIASYEGLTINFCKSCNANVLLRGLRSASDFEYEKNIALVNRTLVPEIETVFLLSIPEFAHISSTIVRELVQHNGNIKNLVPDCIIRDMQK